MKLYRKKPVTVETVTFTDRDSIREISEWAGDAAELMHVEDTGSSYIPLLVIRTLEGDMFAHPGDVIIKGVNGEFYPCKPDIFAATYEEVL